MKWFLSFKGSKRRGGSRSASTTSTKRSWDPQRTLLGLKFLAALAVAAGLIVGWHYAEKALLTYVSEHQSASVPATSVGVERVRLVDVPAWMNPVLARGLTDLAAARVSTDPLDRQSLDDARAALERVPWVRGVRRIQRQADGSVTVDAQFRQPVAVIQNRAGECVVDSMGVVLSGPHRVGDLAGLQLPYVVNVASGAARPGSVWSGAEVEAGLALVMLLREQPYLKEIRAVDVGGRDARGRITLALHTAGGQVRWGLPPGQEQPIEPSAADKLRSLASVYQQRRTIDMPGRVVDVRLSSDAVFIEPASHRHP